MKLSRRKFLTAALAGIPAVAGSVSGRASPSRLPVAAVLEHRENWTTNAKGAAVMLEKAGFHVIRLMPEYLDRDVSVGAMINDHRREIVRERAENPRYDFAVPPDPELVDLIFFGTFTNHGQPYHDYLRRFAADIPAFVEKGGVVCEMCQWARYDVLNEGFLPAGMEIVREPWSDTDEVVVAARHPLLTPWAGRPGAMLGYPAQPGRSGRPVKRRCWQSIAEWKGMRVLLSAGGGYRGGDWRLPGRAAMVEGAHGRGRYLFSSLWLDKLFNEEGDSIAEPETLQVAEAFFRSLKDHVLRVRAEAAPAVTATPQAPEPWIGPLLGHVDHRLAIVWARPPREGDFTLMLWRKGEEDGAPLRRVSVTTSSEQDKCLRWRLDGLGAETEYVCRIQSPEGKGAPGGPLAIRTGPDPAAPAKVALGFGSCLSSTEFGEIWEQIGREEVEGFVLLGDTPYIDSTDTLHNRIKHRELLAFPPVAKLFRSVPMWATWDDHDFGANTSDGRIHNPEGMRRAFLEYRALDGFGGEAGGIYTRFRRGPVEVFVIDCRYFSQTEPSFADPGKPTLLGREQWDWLRDGLRASDAPFKILAGGMTWSDKESRFRDDWEHYAHEREAVIDFIGREKITGVVLVGGDIHATRVERFATENRIGYPLFHFVTSPMHERISTQAAEVAHPGLLFAQAEPNTFLKLTVDTTSRRPLLRAETINMAGGRIHQIELLLSDLGGPTPSLD